MGFDLLSFAGGFAESSMERMDTAEKEAKEFALASTKNMYKKYSDRLDEDKVLVKETASDMAAIQRNFVGKNAFTAEQLAQLAASPSNRKALVEAINSGTMNFDNINPAQMVTLVEKNTAPIAMDKLLQAGQLDQTLNKKLTEQSTFGQMYKGFYAKGAESAGKAVEEKTARAFGTTVEEMQNKLAEKRPEATATFDFTGLRAAPTLAKSIENATTAIVAATKSGNADALNKAETELKGLADQKKKIEAAFNGPDYAKQFQQSVNETAVVLSNPSAFPEDQVKKAKMFQAYQRSEEKAIADIRRGPKEAKDSEVHLNNILNTGMKEAVGNVTFKARNGSEVVMNPVLGGKPVPANSAEGAAIIQAVKDDRAKKLLFFGGSLNDDGSIKTSKAAQAITAYGISTYTDNGKLFIGSKPAPVDVNAGKTPDKPLPIPTSAQDLKAGAYYTTKQGVALWDGEAFNDKPVAVPAAVAASAAAPLVATGAGAGRGGGAGFATRPEAKEVVKPAEPTRNLYAEQQAAALKSRESLMAQRKQKEIEQEAADKSEQEKQSAAYKNIKNITSAENINKANTTKEAFNKMKPGDVYIKDGAIKVKKKGE